MQYGKCLHSQAMPSVFPNINEFIIPKLNPLESASSRFQIRLCVPACAINRELKREVL